jgi:hypothetical protein
MRVGLMAENPLESATGIVPIAMLEGYAPAYSRAVLTATRLGVFDALKDRGRSAQDVADACRTDSRATEKLLNLLVTMRYLRYRGGAYTLVRNVRRWLLADDPGSIRDIILMKELEWTWIDQMEAFVRDGRPLDVHGSMSTDDWRAYQLGMRAQANVLAARPADAGAGQRDGDARHRRLARLLLRCDLPAAPRPARHGARPAARRGARSPDPGTRGDGRPGGAPRR